MTGFWDMWQGSWHVDDEQEVLAKAVLARRTDVTIRGRLDALALLRALQVCTLLSPCHRLQCVFMS